MITFENVCIYKYLSGFVYINTADNPSKNYKYIVNDTKNIELLSEPFLSTLLADTQTIFYGKLFSYFTALICEV